MVAGFGCGPGAMSIGLGSMLLVWAGLTALILGVGSLAHGGRLLADAASFTGPERRRVADGDAAVEALKERYARGELDETELDQRLDVLLRGQGR